MASRKWHVNAGLLSYFITMFLLFILESYSFIFPRDFSWLVIAFLMSIFGSQSPDLDQMWKKLFNHRDWFTHSAFPELIMTFLIFIAGDREETNILYPIMAFFFIGKATHLFLDYFPTWNPHDKDIMNIAYSIEWFATGLTGEEISQKLTGTYLIHFPGLLKWFGFERETLGTKMTRFYLFTNGIILIGLGVFFIISFNRFS